MSRDTLEILNIVRYLKERGISMHFENEKLDSMNSEAEAYITLACAVAQEESRNCLLYTSYRGDGGAWRLGIM